MPQINYNSHSVALIQMLTTMGIIPKGGVIIINLQHDEDCSALVTTKTNDCRCDPSGWGVEDYCKKIEKRAEAAEARLELVVKALELLNPANAETAKLGVAALLVQLKKDGGE